ncbi:28S ribosomal protein S17, mitochondrial [Osmia bicornis bicornis]|uniref:28S ribosomal protein S17, mitochondrial n=1 Tax=Osmia bicornis bicornis TaxID=1437191 RepID=UPI0010F4DC45|nr:28S ribosomal protein S17, mitochondrial [Osmia bicornis bicornis]
MNIGKLTKIPHKKRTLTYLLGVCVPSNKYNAAKIRVRRLEFDDYLSMHFPTFEFVYATDPEKLCKTGDTVLIQNLPEKLTRFITHKIVEVIYPLGNVIDPVTGKPVIAAKYRETVQEDAELFGKLPSMYDFTKPVERGRLENIRDFSSRKTYVKHKKDENHPDPYALDPV